MDTPLLLIASTNPGKLQEIVDILGPAPFSVVLPVDLGLHLTVMEDGTTYAENAALKAEAYSQITGLTVLGDDSGLEVTALDGQPGLRSARYAPWPNATDADRRRYLLSHLQTKPHPWLARFVCNVAISAPGRPTRLFEGSVAGEILPEERGTGGFGYDPLFYLPSHGLSMAELPAAEKNRISHRGRALQAALPYLLEILSPGSA